MSESIIEKLGITPGPWRNSEGMGYIFADRIGGCRMELQQMTVANTRGYGCLKYHGEEKANSEMNANENVIASAPEMLEALIEVSNKLYFTGYCAREVNGWDHKNCDLMALKEIESFTNIIEKATGKSWTEIKELLNA